MTASPFLLRASASVAALGLLLLGACAKPLPPAPLPPLPTGLASTVRAYAGCWALGFDRTFPGAEIDSAVTVALDTVIIQVRGERAALRARGLTGFTRGRKEPFELLWEPRLPPDTTQLAIRGLSGVGWRLAVMGDSVSGRGFEYWDLGPDETAAGSVWGHRVACDAAG